ncbi:MAG TPA: DoxX family protein [Candidatus Polarisedimenticolia bacterium]|nr:DoxX family protein [Candidatus Polarisedimenticolia bacterium]
MKPLNAGLWIAQVILSALFLFAGGMKLVLPIDSMEGPVQIPPLMLRLVGLAEVLGGLGLILPGVTRIAPWLTPLAAGGLVAIMIGAVVITLAAAPAAYAVTPVLTGLLAAFVAYGRWRLAPLGRPARRP